MAGSAHRPSCVPVLKIAGDSCGFSGQVVETARRHVPRLRLAVDDFSQPGAFCGGHGPGCEQHSAMDPLVLSVDPFETVAPQAKWSINELPTEVQATSSWAMSRSAIASTLLMSTCGCP